MSLLHLLVFYVDPTDGRERAQVLAEGDTIGSAAGCTLRLGSPSVAGSHARIERVGHHLGIRQLDDDRPVFHNGTLKGVSVVTEGDTLHVGEVRLTAGKRTRESAPLTVPEPPHVHVPSTRKIATRLPALPELGVSFGQLLMVALVLAPVMALLASPLSALARRGAETLQTRFADSPMVRVRSAVVTVAAFGADGASYGSGLIVGRGGLVVTNEHVVHGARALSVHLADGRVVTAEVVRSDRSRDLAALRLATRDSLVTATLSTSGPPDPGDTVTAIGSPLSSDLELSMTRGIASSNNRRGRNGVTYIQHDASINPGNSGGPLVDEDGEVVGINTWKIAGGAEGLGFAIPSSDVRDFLLGLSRD